MNTHAPASASLHPSAQEPGSVLVRWGRAWERFFFTPADPTTLGMIRICCGLICLYTVIAFTLDLQEFFGKHAWVDLTTRDEYRHEYPYQGLAWSWKPVKPKPPAPGSPDEAFYKKWGVTRDFVITEGHPVWSIWFHVTDPTAMALVHGCMILVTFLFMIGFCTRVTSVLVWFGFLSYLHRSPTTVFGVDAMMSIALLYLMIGPSGAALSVDRLIRRWWLTYRALRPANRARETAEGGRAARVPSLAVTPSVSANFAIRLFQIHVCFIYEAAGLSKLQGISWWNGEAIWGTLVNFEFAPMQYGFYNDFLQFLCGNVFLWQLFMTTGTMFTLVFEIGFPFLVWGPRTRWVVVAMAVTLHGGIGLFMGLKTFSLMMLTLVMSFVPPEAIRRLLRTLACAPAGLRLYFSGQDRRSVRAASVVRALDVWDQVELVDRQGEPAARADGSGAGRLRLVDPDGRSWTGAGLALHLVAALGLFRVFSPWCWCLALARSRDREVHPPTPPTPPVAERAGLRPPHEGIKAASTSMRRKR
jgi:hypothetical protein